MQRCHLHYTWCFHRHLAPRSWHAQLALLQLLLMLDVAADTHTHMSGTKSTGYFLIRCPVLVISDCLNVVELTNDVSTVADAASFMRLQRTHNVLSSACIDDVAAFD